jgi:hypothetical protein
LLLLFGKGAAEREKTYKPCLDAVEEHFSHIPEEDRLVYLAVQSSLAGLIFRLRDVYGATGQASRFWFRELAWVEWLLNLLREV